MKTIIISDIHHRIGWVENFIVDQTFDEIVFLGDYFDQFGDTPKQAGIVAKWLKHSLTCNRRVHLMGNHDQAYAFPNIYEYRCSGFTEEKCEIINSILTREDWNKLKLCHPIQGWLLSHAGAHPHHFESPVNGTSIEGIQEQCQRALELARIGTPTHYMAAGMSRGGSELYGGITWLDISEFKPIPNIHQIFGHSRLHKPVEISLENSKNWGIDCDNRFITIIEDGVIKHIVNDYL